MHGTRGMLVGMGLLAAGCSKPPPAPESLNEAVGYMFREFYSADPEFQAGVQGFMNWYYDEGQEIEDLDADIESVHKYSLDPLQDEDVAMLPLDDEILLHANKDEWGPRDLSAAIGVISVASMDCTWRESEEYLTRPDQDTVFSGDWEDYDRDYLASYETFLSASQDLSFDAIDDPLDPFAAGYDDSAMAGTLLRTVNQADPGKVLTSNIEAYELNLDLPLRHPLESRHTVGDLVRALGPVTKRRRSG